MIPTDDPRPRTEIEEIPDPWRPAVGARIALPIRGELMLPFGEVLEKRASRRTLAMPSRDALGALLWHGARSRSLVQGRESRSAPSAGGLHPIALLVFEPPFTSAALYDPIHHALAHLHLGDPAPLAAACSSFTQVLPEARGVFLLGLADVERTAAVYERPESLVWRDAGCLFATLHLTATALGLGSCLMGILGAEVAKVAVPDGRVVPVGAMAVGVEVP